VKRFKGVLIVLFIALAGMQFIPANSNQDTSTPSADFIKTFDPPIEVALILKKSCYDCHSNNTRYPWYGHIQPVKWYLEKHVSGGKSELNFNEFASWSLRKQRNKLESMIHQIEQDEMPLTSYTWMHADAQISPEKNSLIVGYLTTLHDNL